MLCYHATTTEGLQNILDNIGYKEISPWLCSSNDGAMYFYPTNKYIENHCLGEESEEYIRGGIIRDSLFNGDIQLLWSSQSEVYIIECEISDELLEDDYSCVNMSDSASYIPLELFSKNMIKSIHKSSISSYWKPVIASPLLSNSEFNQEELDEEIREFASNLIGCEELINQYYDLDRDIVEVTGQYIK